MTLTADKVHSGMELVDLLLGNAGETSGYRSNQPWANTVPDTLSQGGAADDFLEALLAGSDTSSTPASPLWSPCTSDSGVADDLLAAAPGPHPASRSAPGPHPASRSAPGPHPASRSAPGPHPASRSAPGPHPASRSAPGPHPASGWAPGPHPASRSAFPAFDAQAFLQHSPLDNHLPPDERLADVSIDLGWEAADLQDQLGITYYLSTNQSSPLAPSQTVTVRDLLLSNLGQKSRRLHHEPLQELQLDEDEKKLLTKEGVHLPSKLPLSKFEERVLKKIRRKIRNKRSAQESRKKKREYVDGLEGRMTMCSAHNLELQRRIQQLEETNNALLEQLGRLQALLPNSPNKATHRGTRILVLLLSFSLIISSHLQPDPYSQLSRGGYTKSKAPSRSLQSMEEARDAPPAALPFLAVSRILEALRSLTGTPRPWRSPPTVDLASSPHQDHRSQEDH